MKIFSEKQKIALKKQGQFLQKFNKQNRKIKEEDKKKIIELYNAGLSCNQIAKIYKCSKFPILKTLKTITKRKSSEYPQHFSKNQKYGSEHHAWKGGYKNIYSKFRDLAKYYEWRNLVLKRDNNCCTKCFSTLKLHSHHIVTLKTLINTYCTQTNKQISDLEYKDLVNDFFYNIDNGLTLCEICHKQHHKEFGR